MPDLPFTWRVALHAASAQGSIHWRRMSTLPPEILSSIFANVRTHQWGIQLPAADQACSQVCRKWKNPAQSHVYGTVSLSMYKPLAPFCRLIQQFPEVAAHSRFRAAGTTSGRNPACRPRMSASCWTASRAHTRFVSKTSTSWAGRSCAHSLRNGTNRWCAYESDLVLLPGVACTVFDFLSFVDVEHLFVSGGFCKFRFKSPKSQELRVRRIVRTRNKDAARPVVREITLDAYDGDPFLEVALTYGGVDKDALRSVTIYDEESQHDAVQRDQLVGQLLSKQGGSIRHFDLGIAMLVAAMQGRTQFPPG
ncbi:hypothetical protein C8Q78DRAFT_93487 [Trametes maxima]|nr:hypothetical protein C8Q78DRAFT_93487 [Trametes maxima]